MPAGGPCPRGRAGNQSRRAKTIAPFNPLARMPMVPYDTSFDKAQDSQIMGKEFIRIGGAREHNLKNLTLEIPRDKLVVITGLSGSGKSSLAFDTIYAEGQRKYVESLSAYARQFLDQMQKPDVDFIEGLSPAIAIEQRSSGSSPRSIIATTTE